MKKALLVLMLLTTSVTVVNAGKLEVIKKIGTWLWNHKGAIAIGATIAPDLVSAAGYEDDDYDPASEDIEKAIEEGKIHYNFTFCRDKDGNEVAVSNDVVSCHDGSTPRNGITIDLSKLIKD